MEKMHVYCQDCGEGSTIQTKEYTDGAIPKGTKCPHCQSTKLIED